MARRCWPGWASARRRSRHCGSAATWAEPRRCERCEVHTVADHAFAWARKGGADFAIGDFLRSWRAGLCGWGGVGADGWKEPSVNMVWGRGCRTGGEGDCDHYPTSCRTWSGIPLFLAQKAGPRIKSGVTIKAMSDLAGSGMSGSGQKVNQKLPFVFA
jgi:hypothetical protein